MAERPSLETLEAAAESSFPRITYDEAIAASERFVVSSDPQVPFRVYDMQQFAKDLIERRKEACGD